MTSLILSCLSAFLIILNALHSNSGELFTAVVDLQKVLYAEREVAHDLRSYVEKEQARLDILLGLADDFEKHSELALANPEKHVSNPVRAFQLVKRFTTDWENIVDSYIRSNASEEFLERLMSKTNKFPDQEDLSGAATALLRLQDTYALTTDKVAHGELQGIQNSALMTAGDCFELGRVAYNDADFYHTVLWMKEALLILDLENPPTMEKSVILDYLAYATFKQGNPREALKLTNEFLLLEPDHVRAQTNKKYYESILESEGENDEAKNERPMNDYKSSTEFTTYERLCRGEKTHVYKYQHKLTCQYRRHHPMFYISPLKEEEFYLKPRIVIYHDSIYPSDRKSVV